MDKNMIQFLKIFFWENYSKEMYRWYSLGDYRCNDEINRSKSELSYFFF